MKTNFLLFIGIITIALTLASCQQTKDAQVKADVFFKLIVKEKYSDAAKMIEVSVLDTTNYTIALEHFGNDQALGKLKSAKKGIGFNSKISNGVSNVDLPYELTYERGKLNRTVYLIDRGEGFKIQSIE